MLGKTLVSRYRIDAELGRGGMGVVYRGFDVLLARPVAIKMISPTYFADEASKRMLSEARAVARLNHPNIVTIFDVLETDGSAFIIMELVEGGTLRMKSLPSIAQTIEYVRQICSALSQAHARGIIHRDIKPENVLLTAEGIVKLNDFGLARRMDTSDINDAGQLMGTFAYMAPELIQGGDPGPQTDLYALGVVLYELLTGSLPFKGNDIAHLFAALLRGKIPHPKDINQSIPEALNHLVIQLLSKAPQDRPESAQAVEATLAGMQPDKIVTQAFVADPEAAQEWKRAAARKETDRDWRKKTYPKSSVPVLGPGEKEQIFANRQHELAASVTHLQENRLLVVTGMPGIGKSTLARALLEFMPPDTPPPFWYDFERQKSSGNTLGVLLDRLSAYIERIMGGSAREEIMSFRDNPDQLPSVHDVDILIDFLNQNFSLWLVFDNLETALQKGGNGFLDKDLELLFEGLKDSSHHARVIITSPLVPILQSGDFLLDFGTQPLTLQGLDEAASIGCLRANGLQDFSDEVLAPITRLVNGHPFALKHIARYITNMGLQAALDNLEGGLDGFLEHFQAMLLQRLSEAEYQALRELTVLQRDIPLDGLCKVAQARPAMMERLRAAGLLEKNISGSFWLPSLIKTGLRIEDKVETRAAHLRALEYYRQQKRPVTARQMDDYSNVLEWHFHALSAGDMAAAYAAVFSTGLFFSLKSWNEYALLRGVCEDILTGLEASQGIISRQELVRLLLNLGDAYFILRDLAGSMSANQRALELLTPEDDPQQRARLLIRLGDAQRVDGKNDAAKDSAKQALLILEQKPDVVLRAQAMQVLGGVLVSLGDFPGAIANLEQALAGFESAANRQGVAFTSMEIGAAYCYWNHFDQALENYSRSLAASQEIKDEYGVVLAHYNLGDMYLQLGRYDEALGALETAVELARRKKFNVFDLASGLYLTETYIALGRLEDAGRMLDGLDRQLTEIQDPVYLGHASRLRAGMEWRQGNLVDADTHFRQVFELLGSDPGRYERGRARLEFAAYLQNLGRTGPAKAALMDAIKDFSALNNLAGMQRAEKALQDLGDEPEVMPVA